MAAAGVEHGRGLGAGTRDPGPGTGSLGFLDLPRLPARE
ncbi:hypothetical protein GLE_3742 [Lysobacter enzymogenes]|uniref:Uncharacterized protein n=1 Tax=Lysobacter enzymogenes TaxID=69 RepID=A0A0S2DKK9_LYSEN|nr:hypothetical protein GLE_3742 [Lysobacter enzymogenes]